MRCQTALSEGIKEKMANPDQRGTSLTVDYSPVAQRQGHKREVQHKAQKRFHGAAAVSKYGEPLRASKRIRLRLAASCE